MTFFSWLRMGTTFGITWVAISGMFSMAAIAGFQDSGSESLEKSAYYAFVDRQFIFTVEMIKPGVPIFNFVSMIEEQKSLLAKQVRLTLETRKVSVRFFTIDTGNPKDPAVTPSVRMRPRSSFGVRLRGDFGDATEIRGVTIQVGAQDLAFEALSSFEFEALVLKVNRLNLQSPDFRDDWRVLKLETMGNRKPTRRRY